MSALLPAFWRVHWVQVVQGSRVSGSLSVCSVPLSCLLSSLMLLLSCNTCKISPISHFKGVLRHFLSLYVGLLGLGALRGLWGFYVREGLGGFGACCVFCLSFSSLVLLFCFRPALLLGFLPCLLSCSLSCFLVLLHCLCGSLWVCCWCCFFPIG